MQPVIANVRGSVALLDQHLQDLSPKPQVFACRWLTLLLVAFWHGKVLSPGEDASAKPSCIMPWSSNNAQQCNSNAVMPLRL